MRFQKVENGVVLDGEGDLVINWRNGAAMTISDFKDDDVAAKNWYMVRIEIWSLRGILATLLIKLAIWLVQLRWTWRLLPEKPKPFTLDDLRKFQFMGNTFTNNMFTNDGVKPTVSQVGNNLFWDGKDTPENRAVLRQWLDAMEPDSKAYWLKKLDFDPYA